MIEGMTSGAVTVDWVGSLLEVEVGCCVIVGDCDCDMMGGADVEWS
jgi:hypothetical protein